MAINDTATHLFEGDRKNRKQGIRIIPAQALANKPGILGLQDVDDSGVIGEHYIWFDSNNAPRFHTSIPADQDSDGTLFDTGTSGADTALSNLASVQINTSLLSDTANTDDIGTDAAPWRTAYLGTSLVFDQTTRNLTITASEPGTSARTVNFGDPGANDSVAYLAASQALTTKTYNGLTIVAGSNAISLTQGTATIAVAAAADLNVAAGGNVDFGTGIVNFAGTAAFDQATGTTVNIDQNLTCQTAACVIDQDLSATGAPTWTSAVTCQGLINTVAAIDTTFQMQIGADNVKLTFGADDDSDSYIQYTGANLSFWDTTGGPYTLQELATGTTLNPTVYGDLTIIDGNFTWTNASAAESAVWTLAATTVDGIQIASSCTSADVIQITADAMANGTGILVDCDGGVGATGYYFRGYNGSANVFAVGEDGKTTITGTAAGTGQLSVSGVAAQTASMVMLDGTTGAGWDGATGVGQLHIINDGAQVHVAASALYIDLTAAPITACEGAAIHVIQSGGAAVTNGYLVNIEAVATGGALHVDGGVSLFDEIATFTSGLNTMVAVNNVHDTTPTQDEMDTAFGNASAANKGFIGIIDDANGGTNVYLCYSDGANWFFLPKGTVGGV